MNARTITISLVFLAALAGSARAQLSPDQVLELAAQGKTGEALVSAVVEAGGVSGVDDAALSKLRLNGLDEATVLFVSEYRSLDDWVPCQGPEGAFHLRRPPVWNIYVATMGAVTASREKMENDETEINSGVTILLMANPNPANYTAERLAEAGRSLHEGVVALAGKRGDKIWDISESETSVGGVPCTRFDALMDTHRGDRLVIWTHFGFPAGKMLVVMASRNREEPSSAATLERLLSTIRFGGPMEAWRDPETGASLSYPKGWVVKKEGDSGEVRFRPTALPGARHDAELAWNCEPASGTALDEIHAKFLAAARSQDSDLSAEREEPPPFAGARMTWLGSPKRPFQIWLVTLVSGERAHRLRLSLTGDHREETVARYAEDLDRMVRSFRPGS
ncbi:MAG: hypothetical protein HY720_06290 [Planctomycetes bacterium]|nr:hypothetical protein [Planctomycetota bacterium]